MRGQLIGQHQTSGGYAALVSSRQSGQILPTLCRAFDVSRAGSKQRKRPATAGRTHARRAVPKAVRLAETYADASRQTSICDIARLKHRRPLPALSAVAGRKQVSADQVIAVTSGAMIMAAVHRVTFSVLAVPFAAEFNMTLPDMGLLQSAALFGYLLGQIPAGVVADRFGGVHVLLTGLACWSSMTGLNPLARYSSQPLLTLVGMRAALGLAQSCMMPSVSATAARWVAPSNRGKALSVIYAASSSGTVLGLMATPFLAQLLGGWPACFIFFAGLGILWAGGCWLFLPPPSAAPYSAANVKLAHSAAPSQQRSSNSSSNRPSSSNVYNSRSSGSGSVSYGIRSSGGGSRYRPSAGGGGGGGGTQTLSADASTVLGIGREQHSRTGNTIHILALCWVHSVIGWGFFILQSWIPTYLTSLGLHDLSTVGLLSALPWVGTAIAAVSAGKLANHLRDQRGWDALHVRTFCQDIATIGPALSLVPLLIGPQSSSIPVAVLCLTSTLSLQAFCYAGFHAYVQDVAPEDAGKLLGITNTCGTVVGIAGNILTGNIAASQRGYSAVFALISAGYLSSYVVWRIWVNGHNIVLGKRQEQ